MAFGLFVLVEASLGHSLIGGYEQPVFMGILGAAVIFEVGWYGVHRTNAIPPRPSVEGAGRHTFRS